MGVSLTDEQNAKLQGKSMYKMWRDEIESLENNVNVINSLMGDTWEIYVSKDSWGIRKKKGQSTGGFSGSSRCGKKFDDVCSEIYMIKQILYASNNLETYK